jgi:hypothetical protein
MNLKPEPFTVGGGASKNLCMPHGPQVYCQLGMYKLKPQSCVCRGIHGSAVSAIGCGELDEWNHDGRVFGSSF